MMNRKFRKSGDNQLPFPSKRQSQTRACIHDRMICQIGKERFVIDWTVTNLPRQPAPVIAFPKKPRRKNLRRR
jgi:hypothetical protein